MNRDDIEAAAAKCEEIAREARRDAKTLCDDSCSRWSDKDMEEECAVMADKCAAAIRALPRSRLSTVSPSTTAGEAVAWAVFHHESVVPVILTHNRRAAEGWCEHQIEPGRPYRVVPLYAAPPAGEGGK